MVIVPRIPIKNLKEMLPMYRMQLFDQDGNKFPTKVSKGFHGILR